MIQLSHIYKTYVIGKREVHALTDISLTIEKGDFLAVKGPSGSGKSTMLNIIGLVDIPTKGDYYLDGIAMNDLGLKARSEIRKEYLGFIFQNYNLIPELTVYENVEIPLLISKYKKAERKQLVEAIVEEVGLTNYIKHRPGELSGGQQQRVAIARALVKNPPVVVADEPTANLDSKTSREIIELMRTINERHGTTCIFATHDELILNCMDAVVYLQDGRIIRTNRRFV